MSDVFLCHASEDKERVAALAEALRREGLDVWWDAELKVGQLFPATIDKELPAARCVVICWSRHSMAGARDWIRGEAEKARYRDAAISVLLDDIRPNDLPTPFNIGEVANLVRWDGERTDPAFRGLVEGIAGKGRPSPSSRGPGTRRKSALLVGAGRYDGDLPALPAAERDLDDLEKLLVQPVFGFDVKTLRRPPGHRRTSAVGGLSSRRTSCHPSHRVLATKDAIFHFRAAPWRDEAEMNAFVAACSLAAADVVKLLNVVLEPEMRSDPAAHHRRVRVLASLLERTLDPSLFVPCARALRAADANLRSVLVGVLPRVNSAVGHPELCLLLGAPDPAVRAAAAGVLAQVGGKIAFDALIELARDPGFTGRVEALGVMAPRALHLVAPLIRATLEHGDPNERLYALSVLADPKYFGRHADSAVEVAKRALSDPDERIVREGVLLLAFYDDETTFMDHTEAVLESDQQAHVRAVIEALRRFPSPATLRVLSRKLDRGPNQVRFAVLDTAHAIGDETVLPLLVEALSHDELVVRSAALEVVGRLSDAGKIDASRAILWLLKSRDVNVRRIAVEVLNRVGDRAGDLAPRMLRHLRDEDWWVRERTMDAIVEIAGPSLGQHLLPYLGDPSAIIRRFAVCALKRIREPLALASLLQIAATDEDWWVCEEAISAVAQMGDPRVAGRLLSIAHARADLRCACVEALATLHASEDLGAIAIMATDEDPDVRFAAIQAVGALGGPERADVIEICATDPVPRVRKAARELLLRWNVDSDSLSSTNRVVLDEVLADFITHDGDDLILHAGKPPFIKRRGRVETLEGWRSLSSHELYSMIEPCLSTVQRGAFASGADVDFSYEMRGEKLRFRVNLFNHEAGVGAVFRAIRGDAHLTSLEDLGLPAAVGALSAMNDGLVLVGGPTGAGKSTTLAALVHRINLGSSRHIVTIEDPIEALHSSQKALVTQREVGSHTESFATALRAAMRQDPDVILVGEMRDRETFQFAVSAAETGHLVLGTIHATSAETCVARIVNAFPAGQQIQVRAMLAASLRAIVCQNLLRKKDGSGRVLAAEVLLNNDAIASLIRKGRDFQIPSTITTQRAAGMQLMDHELARLVREGVVEMSQALPRATDKVVFETLARGVDPAGEERRQTSRPPRISHRPVGTS